MAYDEDGTICLFFLPAEFVAWLLLHAREEWTHPLRLGSEGPELLATGCHIIVMVFREQALFLSEKIINHQMSVVPSALPFELEFQHAHVFIFFKFVFIFRGTISKHGRTMLGQWRSGWKVRCFICVVVVAFAPLFAQRRPDLSRDLASKDTRQKHVLHFFHCDYFQTK